MVAKSINPIDYQNVPRAVGAMSKEFPDGCRLTPHTHERAQLVYAVAGVMEIVANGVTWIIPPQRALWIPGGIEHSMLARGSISLRTLYVRSDAPHFPEPGEPRSIRVSPLLRELILRAVDMPIEYDENGRDGAIVDLLLQEIEFMPDEALRIAVPHDRRLRRLCDFIRAHPDDNRGLAELAPLTGASGRTLTRLARAELGVPLLYWRHQVRLLEALPRLAWGEPITSVALSLGYETPSAFTAMFSRTMGKTPSQYLAEIGEPMPAPVRT